MTENLRLGPLEFEYDADRHELYVTNGGTVKGMVEVSPEDWAAFAHAVRTAAEALSAPFTSPLNAETIRQLVRDELHMAANGGMFENCSYGADY